MLAFVVTRPACSGSPFTRRGSNWHRERWIGAPKTYSAPIWHFQRPQVRKRLRNLRGGTRPTILTSSSTTSTLMHAYNPYGQQAACHWSPTVAANRTAIFQHLRSAPLLVVSPRSTTLLEPPPTASPPRSIPPSKPSYLAHLHQTPYARQPKNQHRRAPTP
jgi:hypothetical protein